MTTHYIAIHLVKVYSLLSTVKDRELITVLAWGDEVKFIADSFPDIKIQLKGFKKHADGSIEAEWKDGFITISRSSRLTLNDILKPIAQKDVLKVDFVDVQQGDGSVIETPSGKVVLVDGGDNQLFARYLAGRFIGTSATDPKTIDCILVTHGDADHYSGLSEIYKSEARTQTKAWKKIFIKPERVYHNGIVKRTGKLNNKNRKDVELLGPTISNAQNSLYVQPLVDDLLQVPNQEMNKPFLEWKRVLTAYKQRNPNLLLKRLDHNSQNPFSFLDQGVQVEVLGPITEKVNGQDALKFLSNPPKLPVTKQRGAHTTGTDRKDYSASHTINGHSVIFKLTYGQANFLFCGDLNEEAENILVQKNQANPELLRAEILKVPHHGSADFSNDFLQAVNPLVSIVSSGDESEKKEYIHPRATLMGALGKHSRIDRPLIFVTELVAFFKREGWARVTEDRPKNTPIDKMKEIYAFSRTDFGIVKVRTDGNKLFVYTNSGQTDMKEAYVYDLTTRSNPTRIDLISV